MLKNINYGQDILYGRKLGYVMFNNMQDSEWMENLRHNYAAKGKANGKKV